MANLCPLHKPIPRDPKSFICQLINHKIYFIFSDPENSKQLVVVGCEGGQTLVVKIGDIKSYEHRNDLSLPAELKFVTFEDLANMEDEEFDPKINYGMDLSGEFQSC